MPDAIFFRLLSEDVEDKPAALEAQLAALNAGDFPVEVSIVSDGIFAQIPGSPFAYWMLSAVLRIFSRFKPLEGDTISARLGTTTNDDLRFLRHFWEVGAKSLQSYWVPFAKGGAFSQYFYDIHLVLDWENRGERLRQYCIQRGDSPSRNIRSEDKYFRPGLTWPRRTQKGFNVRAMPAAGIFADKGPAIFVDENDKDSLMALLGVANSSLFKTLVELQMAFGSYEVGVIQRTPIPDSFGDKLASFAHHAHDFQREKSLTDETTHVFQLPALLTIPGESLAEGSAVLSVQAQARQDTFSKVQEQINDIVFDLYALDEADRQLVRREMGTALATDNVDDEPEADDEDSIPNDDLPSQAQNLLMWCVGVVFGRWDVRKALDPSRLPPLPEPFDPLPRCAPGALINDEGLPVSKSEVPDDYPLPIAWEGVLLDDPAQEGNPESLDIVARVRSVLTLLWGNRADDIESELCAALGVHTLRDYFRNPSKGFFNFHIKRYSKSRRKAPIYWLLQSEKRNCAVWVYYPRLEEPTLFFAENVIYDLMQRERFRMDEFRANLATFGGTERKRNERLLDTQTKLVAEIEAFHKDVLQAANQRLTPNHNDGVLISIAPLHNLVPWKEAGVMWQELLRDKYPWSGMSAQMKKRGLLKAKE